MQLDKKIFFRGKIVAETGLLIGGTNTAFGIGGPDKTVIRDPMTNRPYIPGSSLKGKMRSLMELTYQSYGDKRMGAVTNGPGEKVTNIATYLFGNAIGDRTQRPSRVLVRDGFLLNADQINQNTELPFTETKTEVVIDRLTSKAMPRNFERVPAGAQFSLNLVLNIFSNDDLVKFTEEELRQHVLYGLLLVQDDYLGGSGSRGSGRVRFQLDEVFERSAAYYHSGGKTEQRDIWGELDIPAELRPATV